MVVWIKTVNDKEPSPYYVDETNTVYFLNSGIEFWGIYDKHWFSYSDVVKITETMKGGDE